MNLTAPVVPDEREYTGTTQFSLKGDVLPWGSDNLFPDALIELKRNSAVHAAIIHSKKVYITGKEVNYAADGVRKLVEAANGQDTLRDVIAKLSYDLVLYGNAVVEVVRSNGGIAVFHKDAAFYRMHKDGDKVIYNPEWHNYKAANNVTIPLWPKFDKSGRSIYFIKQYEPGNRWYGLPDYVAGMNAATILYKTDKWNLSRLDNSFKASGILLVDADLSPDEARKFETDFDAKFTGEENTGRVMKVVKELASDKTKFIPMSENYDADWAEQQAISEGNIITAHSWFRSLSGLSDNTGFDTQRILQEYEIALNTVVYDFQAMLVGCFNRLAAVEMGVKDAQITIVNKPPLTLATMLNVNRITRIWEGRQMLGLDYDSEDITQQRFIDDNTATGQRDSASA